MRQLEMPDAAEPPTPGSVIPAADIRHLSAIADLHEAALAEAANRSRRLRRAYYKAMARGFRTGRRAGVTDALQTALADVAALKQAQAREEDTIIGLAFDIAQTILGNVPETDRVRRVVETALKDEREAQHLSLRISPDFTADLQEALASTIAVSGLDVTLETDPTLSDGMMTLATQTDAVAIDPDSQLAALRHRLAGGGVA